MEGIIFALGLSMHVGLEGDYNEVHPHVRFIEDGAIAGVYYNSVDRLSVYAGHRVDMGDAGIEFALVTGYPAYGTIAPFVRGTYDFGDNVRAFVSPAVESYGNNNSDIGVVFGIEFSLK
jgi:hypothetical protein